MYQIDNGLAAQIGQGQQQQPNFLASLQQMAAMRNALGGQYGGGAEAPVMGGGQTRPAGPMNAPGDMRDIIHAAAARYNISPETLMRVAQTESNFDPRSVSSTGAKGLFQFIPSAQKDFGLADPFDPHQSADAGARMWLDRANYLRRNLGRDPSDGEVYLAYQQGPAGALHLLRNPDMPVIDALSGAYQGDRSKAARAIVVNGGHPGMTAADFSNKWISRFNPSPAYAGL